MHDVTVSIIDPTMKSSLKRFIQLERQLMKSYPRYIAEMDDDIAKTLTRKKVASKNLDICLFIVSQSGIDVGRCAAIINPRFQQEKQAGAGFIGFFAAAEGCYDAIAQMMQQAENWLKTKGVTKVIAPSNGGAPNTMGMLTTAFDEDPMFPLPWTPPYYLQYVEAMGYRATYPLWCYDIDFTSEKYTTAKQHFSGYDKAVIRTISKKDWNKDLTLLADLLNEIFIDEWEFSSLTHEEIIEFFGPMKSIVSPPNILFAEVDGKPAGFCFALPDLTPLFRSFKGSVGLLAIIKLMTQAKKFSRAGILGIGVSNKYRGIGLSKAIAIKLYSYHESLGLKSSMYYPVNESNLASRGFAESIGGTGRMMYCVYDKPLS